MKHWTLTFLMLLIGFFLFPFLSKAQSISGNVGALSEDLDLGYANVDIYKGDKLVASVLADAEGNFKVNLDTGVYRCEINYAGFKTINKEIVVKSDEKADFDLEEDAESEFKAPVKFKDVSSPYSGDGFAYASEMATSRSSRAKKSYSYTPSKRIMPGDKPTVQPGPGKLTAGEVNDFSKWDLWQDLTEKELLVHQTEWRISPQNRYMVQVTDRNMLPAADLTVKLTTKEGKVLYAARTDNTGKAELWQSLSTDQIQNEKLEIILFKKDGSQEKVKAKNIDNGINSFKIATDCNQSQKVDIAFVVDATGSMSDELNFLKAELNDVVYKSKEISTTLNFSFANVFYRDFGDEYVTKTQDFTRVLSESVSFISQQRAGGGGDYPEAVEVALDSAINGLSWSPYARARLLFLVLDAPPHNTTRIQEKLKILSTQAAEKGIRIVPLVASGINKNAEYLLRSIALATNGTYAFLTDHSGIGNTHIKPSTDDYEVEMLNNLLVRVIKSFTYMPDCQQVVPELDLPYSDSNVVYNPPKDTTAKDSSVQDPINITWKYYPNPTRGIVNIKADVAIPELYVTDLSGKVLQIVKDIKSEVPVRVDLSGYASGIYLIRYPIGKQWVSGKVVLVRS
jgi:hypothetical protein